MTFTHLINRLFSRRREMQRRLQACRETNSFRVLDGGAVPNERKPYFDCRVGDGTCAVCLTNAASVVFEPCGHHLSCVGCAMKTALRQCPACRKDIAVRTSYSCFGAAKQTSDEVDLYDANLFLPSGEAVADAGRDYWVPVKETTDVTRGEHRWMWFERQLRESLPAVDISRPFEDDGHRIGRRNVRSHCVPTNGRKDLSHERTACAATILAPRVRGEGVVHSSCNQTHTIDADSDAALFATRVLPLPGTRSRRTRTQSRRHRTRNLLRKRHPSNLFCSADLRGAAELLPILARGRTVCCGSKPFSFRSRSDSSCSVETGLEAAATLHNGLQVSITWRGVSAHSVHGTVRGAVKSNSCCVGDLGIDHGCYKRATQPRRCRGLQSKTAACRGPAGRIHHRRLAGFRRRRQIK